MFSLASLRSRSVFALRFDWLVFRTQWQEGSASTVREKERDTPGGMAHVFTRYCVHSTLLALLLTPHERTVETERDSTRYHQNITHFKYFLYVFNVYAVT